MDLPGSSLCGFLGGKVEKLCYFLSLKSRLRDLMLEIPPLKYCQQAIKGFLSYLLSEIV